MTVTVDPSESRATLVPGLSPGADAGQSHSLAVEVLKRMARALLNGVIFAILGLLVWEALVKISGITPFIAKGPGDVYHYLFTDKGSAAARAFLNKAFWTTARNASIGFVAGTVAALFFANLFAVRREAQQALMPVAMTLRTVPLVAMTPLIALIFGRGLLGVTVIAAIVTFFPTLVNVTLALRSVPQESFDLMRGYGVHQADHAAQGPVPERDAGPVRIGAHRRSPRPRRRPAGRVARLGYRARLPHADQLEPG